MTPDDELIYRQISQEQVVHSTGYNSTITFWNFLLMLEGFIIAFSAVLVTLEEQARWYSLVLFGCAFISGILLVSNLYRFRKRMTTISSYILQHQTNYPDKLFERMKGLLRIEKLIVALLVLQVFLVFYFILTFKHLIPY